MIEVIISLVLIGIVASAWFVTYSYQSRGSTLNKQIAQADIVLRDYAEATKAAVRATCTPSNGGSPISAQYTPPTGFTVSSIGATCPTSTSDVRRITLNVEFAGPQSRSLQVAVRTS